VRCTELDAGGRRCRWTGRQDQLNGHQHVFDEPAGDEQRQSVTPAAVRKRRADSDDSPDNVRAPSAKARCTGVGVGNGTTQACSVPAGVDENDSSTVRVTDASLPDLHDRPSTDDAQDIIVINDSSDEERESQTPEEKKDEDDEEEGERDRDEIVAVDAGDDYEDEDDDERDDDDDDDDGGGGGGGGDDDAV